jgi:hypothetical protein
MAASIHLVLDTGVFTLGIFTNDNGVNVIVWCLETINGNTWSDVGK